MKTITLKGFPLIIFRAEKISGAVGFVESITKINKIFSTKKYVDIIIDCCKRVLIQLNNALMELKLIIEKLENRYKTECEKRDKFENKYNDYEPMWGRFKEIEDIKREEIYNINKDKEGVYSKNSQLITDLYVEQIKKEYPEWEKTKNEFLCRKKAFEDQKSICSDISSDISNHKSYLADISKYKENIESFI
jgi:hypothetical protein